MDYNLIIPSYADSGIKSLMFEPEYLYSQKKKRHICLNILSDQMKLQNSH